MLKIRSFSCFLLMAVVAALLSGCAPASPSLNAKGSVSAQSEQNPAASAESHASDAKPDYAVVFPQDSVNRIDITLSPESWQAVQNEMVEQFGQQGAGMGAGGFGADGRRPGGPRPIDPPSMPGNGQVPGENSQQPGDAPFNNRPQNGQPGNFPGGGMRAMNFGETSYVVSSVQFNGESWNSVGFRYSGNSTLQTSWRNGTQKISFRLDFDEYEDQDPATQNQRFYGFKQLSFKSNAMDDSYLREKVTGDIFRDAGVIAPQTAFYEVYVDYGEGLKYFGLYTAVEIVDDTVIKTQFSDDSGNVYKPEGTGAAFEEGTFNKESFEKQTNEAQADWSDVQALFTALHSDLRLTDPAAWRSNLEKVLDVDAFIRWLSVDTIVQNWDTYGSMAHNYYLYTDPSDGLITWIPWDNNMALSATNRGPGGDGGPGRGPRDLDLTTVGDQWPLISILMDDPVYQARYRQYLQETIDNTLQPDALAARYQKYHDLIAPYVEKETAEATQLESIERFHLALDELIRHARERYDAVVMFLAGQYN
jgi:spore coat protein CotH